MTKAAIAMCMMNVHDAAGRTTAVQPSDTPCSAATPDPDWFDASDPVKVCFSRQNACV
jgi:hypothetical protein